jgi:hypothetical protein
VIRAVAAAVAVVVAIAGIRSCEARQQAIDNLHCPPPDHAVWIPPVHARGCGESITVGVGSR